MREEICLKSNNPPSLASLVLGEVVEEIQVQSRLSQVFKNSFRPNTTQKKILDIIHNSPLPAGEIRYILLYGSVGSGKTWGAFSHVMDVSLSFPGVFGLIVRRTSMDIGATVIPTINLFCDKFGISSKHDSRKSLITFENGSTILLRSDKSLVPTKGKDKSDSLGSTFFSWAILEEGDSCSEALFDTLTARLRQESSGFVKVVFVICNPPRKSHWIYKKWFENNNPEDPYSPYRAVHCKLEDNRENVPSGWYTSVQKEYNKNPRLKKRMLDGEFGPDSPGTPYFEQQFNPDFHVVDRSLADEWNPAYPIYRCWDFGFRGNSLVIFQDDHDRQQIRVMYSFLEQNTLFKVFARDRLHFLWSKFPSATWRDVADPAGEANSGLSEKNYFDQLYDLGVAHVETRKGRRISTGLAIIAEELTQVTHHKDQFGVPQIRPSILFSKPDCSLLIEALEAGYCNEKEGRVDEDARPIKDGYYDHVMDAFRYGMVVIREDGPPRSTGTLQTVENLNWNGINRSYNPRENQWVQSVHLAGPRRKSGFGRSNY